MNHVAGIVALCISLLWSVPCVAVLYSYSASADPGANPDANSGAANVWTVTLTSGDGGQNGSFQGDSAGNGDGSNVGGTGAGSSAWAMYANSGQTARSTSTLSGLGGPIGLVGDFISMDFDNGFIDDGAQVGVTFLDGSNNTQATFRFTGGESTYKLVDSSTQDTGVGFTDNGFNIKLLLTDTSGGYTFTLGSTSFNRTLAQATSAIASVQVFNMNAGGGSERNLYFNNLQINSVPEPSAALAIPVAVIVCGFGAHCLRRWKARPSGKQ